MCCIYYSVDGYVIYPCEARAACFIGSGLFSFYMFVLSYYFLRCQDTPWISRGTSYYKRGLSWEQTYLTENITLSFFNHFKEGNKRGKYNSPSNPR